MFTGAIPLGRLFGIRVSFSLSWLIIFFLVWFNLAGLYLPAHYPRWPLAFHWAAGLFASVLFFLCVILHELAHCLVAVRYGLPVRGITLFALGGVSHIGRDVPSPRVEFAIALAGPATSLLLGGLAALLWLPLHQVSRPTGDLLLWLGSLNLVLAIFNLLPGFPLDGGRLLRSIVWFAADDFTWATKVASRSGQLAALTMALAGLFLLIEQRRAGLTSGLWLLVIGWFLFSAAGASYHSVMALYALRGLVVRDLMRRTLLTVPADASLGELAESFTARRGDDPAVVLRDEAPVGLIQHVGAASFPRRPARHGPCMRGNGYPPPRPTPGRRSPRRRRPPDAAREWVRELTGRGRGKAERPRPPGGPLPGYGAASASGPLTVLRRSRQRKKADPRRVRLL